MRADYDSKGNSIQIWLKPAGPLDGSDDPVHDRAIVSLRGGRPALIEIHATDEPLESPLRAAAAAYGLDFESLLAAARSALAAPDRTVEIDVADRAAVL